MWLNELDKLVIATGNAKKLKELQNILQPSGITVIPQSEFDVPEAIEDGLSFIENAIIKARNAAQHTGLPAIADDSGLEVDHLNGEPGIYSARYANGQGDAANNSKLLAALEGVKPEQRTARFQCVIAVVKHHLDPTPLIFKGTWEGQIVTEETGDNGFGYDPLFWVPEQNCTSAQLAAEIKNRLSHRGQAIEKLIQYVSTPS